MIKRLIILSIVFFLSSYFVQAANAYQSDRVKKTVISSNIEKESPVEASRDSSSEMQSAKGPSSTSKYKTTVKKDPLIKSVSLSFAFYDNTHFKPSVPYIKLFFNDKISIDITGAFRNISAKTNYSMLDLVILHKLNNSGAIAWIGGAGYTFYSDPAQHHVFTAVIGLETDLTQQVSLGAMYELATAKVNNGAPLLFEVNSGFSTRISWKL